MEKYSIKSYQNQDVAIAPGISCVDSELLSGIDQINKPMNPINVTQPELPPLHEFLPYLEEIWSSKRVTNNGKFHQQLELELADYLGVEYVSLFSNGTLALLVALQAQKITGEVITTPYSFVASTHALHWNGIKPVFADIDPVTLNLDPQKIEAAITPQTTAILPVHIYGTPCDVDAIKYIADIYGLKVIYDAAHAFGIERKGSSILNYGDLSVLSFHGTKVYTTFEGGAIISHDAAMKKRIDFLKNFGFADEVTVVGPGINGKMNEFQAALGVLQLKHIDSYIQKRRDISTLYRQRLIKIPNTRLLELNDEDKLNYSYFPIFIENNGAANMRDKVYEGLQKRGYHSRRYFYPLISSFPTYRGIPSAASENLPIAERISHEVICLPLYPGLKVTDINNICTTIEDILG